MSVLLVDIGNTRVKWALWKNGRLGRQQAAAHDAWTEKDFERALFQGYRMRASLPRTPSRKRGGRNAARPAAADTLERIIVVSVAGIKIERQLTRTAQAGCRLKPEFVRTQRRLGGVTTLYREPWRLGADRFVAAIGGHHLAGERAVCVVDIGTAMTIDLVDARGRHRGGAIVPGPRLMVESLLKDTSGIQRRAGGRAAGRSVIARDTRAAVEQGARYATAAVIDRVVAEARGTLGASPLVLLTGGAAANVQRLIRTRHRLVPDLVLRGLAQLI